MRIDPDAVRNGAARLASAAVDLGTAGTALDRAIQEMGQCWGADESGQRFAADYGPAAEQALRVFGLVGQKLRTLSQTVGTVADGMQHRDDTAAGDIATQGP